MTQTTMAWDDWFANLETGDILLAQGELESSFMIEAIFDCQWSHGAIIVIAGDIGLTSVPPETVLCWESNILVPANPGNYFIPDLILGEPKNGPIIDDLKRRISCNFNMNDDNNYAHRKLNFQRTPEMFATLNSVISATHSAGFPSLGKAEFTNYLIGALFNLPVTDGTYFCTQLLSHTYKAWGLLGPEKVDNAYCPANYGDNKHQISFLQGATLGPEILVDPNTIPAYPGQS
jgi:hypothetical protein